MTGLMEGNETRTLRTTYLSLLAGLGSSLADTASYFSPALFRRRLYVRYLKVASCISMFEKHSASLDCEALRSQLATRRAYSIVRDRHGENHPATNFGERERVDGWECVRPILRVLFLPQVQFVCAPARLWCEVVWFLESSQGRSLRDQYQGPRHSLVW